MTVAEVRFGAQLAGWGPPRLQRLEQRFSKARIVLPGPDLVAAYVKLRTACVRDGRRVLGQKAHEADRWVAATALWLDVPLVAHGNTYRRVPGLELLSRLGDL